jgi:hypothetical protein
VKVRIKQTPLEPEVDGIRLDKYIRGDVREVLPSIGSWLIAEGYAEPEMRQTRRTDDEQFSERLTIPVDVAHDRRSRRR